MAVVRPFRSRLGALICTAGVAALLITAVAVSAQEQAGTETEVAEELAKVREDLKEQEARELERAATANKLLADIRALDRRLLSSSRNRKALAAERQRLEEEYEAHRDRLESLEGEYGKLRSLLARRLSSIYKHGRLGSSRVLLQAAASSEPLRMARYLAAVSRADSEAFGDYETVRRKHELAIAELDAKKADIATKHQALEAELGRYEAARGEKGALLASIEKDVAADKAKKERLIANEEDLQKVLASAPEPEPAPVAATRGAESRSEKRSRGEHARSVVASDATFVGLKGQLQVPVKGEIVSRFGDTRQTGPSHQGVIVRAEADYHVTAVAEGEVVFSGPFPGLGKTLIINHGNRYHTVYAHLDSIQHEVGGQVRDNEVIGSLAAAQPTLHFELRAEGKALDPEEWFHGGYTAFRR